MTIYPVNVSKPSFLDSSRLYTLSYFVRASGLSYTRLQQAKRSGIELKTIACGRRKFVLGQDAIDFVIRLAAHDSKKSND